MSNCFVLGCRRKKIDRQYLARFRNCGGQGTIIHGDTRHVRKRAYLHLFFSLRHFKRSLLCDTAAMKSSTSLFFSFSFFLLSIALTPPFVVLESIQIGIPGQKLFLWVFSFSVFFFCFNNRLVQRQTSSVSRYGHDRHDTGRMNDVAVCVLSTVFLFFLFYLPYSAYSRTTENRNRDRVQEKLFRHLSICFLAFFFFWVWKWFKEGRQTMELSSFKIFQLLNDNNNNIK